MKEVTQAIIKQKLGKAPGLHTITTEPIKYMDPIARQTFCEFLNDIVRQLRWEIPKYWNMGIILLLTRKETWMAVITIEE